MLIYADVEVYSRIFVNTIPFFICISPFLHILFLLLYRGFYFEL